MDNREEPRLIYTNVDRAYEALVEIRLAMEAITRYVNQLNKVLETLGGVEK